MVNKDHNNNLEKDIKVEHDPVTPDEVLVDNQPLHHDEVTVEAVDMDKEFKHNVHHHENHHGHHHHTYRRSMAGSNISWGSIIAGTVTFIALSILFSLIGSAIGFGVPTLTASNPTEGLGMSLAIWAIISLIVALGGAGYVAGLSSARSGLLHGFLTWALSVFTMLFLLTSAVSGIFSTVGTLLGYTGDAVGTVVSTTADGVSTLTEEAFNAISDNLQLEELEGLDQEVVDALENSDVEQLQPDYLQSQLDVTIQEIQDGAKRVVVDGEDAGAVIEEISTNIETRVDDITAEIDEDEVANVIAENSDLTETEARDAVSNAVQSYNEAADSASQMLTDAEVALQELQADAEVAVQETTETTDEVMDEVSKYSLYLFFGLLAAAVITSLAGKAGSKSASNFNEVEYKN